VHGNDVFSLWPQAHLRTIAHTILLFDKEFKFIDESGVVVLVRRGDVNWSMKKSATLNNDQ